MTTLFIVIGCIAGFNALYLFFYVMDDIISQIRKIGKPKNKTTDLTFLDDLDDFEDELKKPEKPETFEIYDVSSLTEEDVYPPQKAPAAPTVSSRSLFACTWRRLSPEASPIKR